jgi:hypothetical protein
MQRAVFDHIRMRGSPGLIVWHTPNGGKRCRIALESRLGHIP